MADVASMLRDMENNGLAVDERYVGGCRVLPKGAAFAIGLGAAGQLGASISATDASVGDAADALGSEAAQQMAFGLTDSRLIVWACGSRSGKPTDVIGEIALSDISGVAFKKSMFGSSLTLTLGAGSVAEFTAVKVDKPQEFADALQARI